MDNRLKTGIIAISTIVILVLTFLVLTPWIYVWDENENFRKIRRKSELNCESLPLHCSIRDNNVDQFNILLKNNIDLEVKDNWGMTALLWALKNQKLDFFEKLLMNNADPNTFDEYGETIFYYAIRSNQFEIAELLITHGANIDALSNSEYPETALHYSVMNNNANAVRFLIKKGVNKGIKDSFGYTALERTVLHDHVNDTIIQMLTKE